MTKRLNVEINDVQFKALKEFAKRYNCSIADVLGNYIADLTQIESNGSDERILAREYFQRTHLAFQYN
ncbi:hypothetical protein [Psychrobacillus sp. L3]|uniref:hypothetical protein n=1 Tax=Psychrobacillus sp. L3 TaxID=3236891 RepID=UPI0036F1B768